MPGLADLLQGGMDDRGYGGGAGDDADDASPDYDESGRAAMKTFIGAVHARDPGAAWEALKQAYEFCEKAGPMSSKEGGDDAKHGVALVISPDHRK